MSEAPHKSIEHAAVGRGYEHSDVSIRPLALFLSVLAASLVVVCSIVAGLFWLLEGVAEQADPPPASLAKAGDDVRTLGPLLQVSPRRDVKLLRAREQRRLNALEWVDRDRGVVRIPIERAIALSAAEGLRTWPAVEQTAPAAGDTEP